MVNEKIIVRTPRCEIELSNLCEKEYLKINNLMTLIEKEFDTNMFEHPRIKKEILDISNYIRNIPKMISEVI